MAVSIGMEAANSPWWRKSVLPMSGGFEPIFVQILFSLYRFLLLFMGKMIRYFAQFRSGGPEFSILGTLIDFWMRRRSDYLTETEYNSNSEIETAKCLTFVHWSCDRRRKKNK